MVRPAGTIAIPLIFLLSAVALRAQSAGAGTPCFGIQVVDEETGRGVPLVELSSTSGATWVTDSNGLAAICEPQLEGRKVFFSLRSHGYEFPKDGFGFAGKTLDVQNGKRETLRLKRRNLAERLYRVTGEGIYRDTVLLGGKPPIREPLLNAQVVGQDSVVTTVYRGRVYWGWGDTSRLRYPLGNFSASGAISELPGRGGLDPEVGIDLSYFLDEEGFTRKLIPFPEPGLKWLECFLSLRDREGRERLVARYAAHKDLGTVNNWGLGLWNDRAEVFEKAAHWDLRHGHLCAHPFRATVAGRSFVYLHADLRLPAELDLAKDLANYESYTCLAPGARWQAKNARVERDAEGRAVWAWKRGTDPVHPGEEREVEPKGALKSDETWFRLFDVETGRLVEGASIGSIAWNDHRGRWIAIASKHPGEIWFAEADTPIGPWCWARRVIAHDRYAFYNPTQHPFFDKDGGRTIFFEGTYSDFFSGAPVKTPRYDYNQILYRLRLDDPRLALPAPVYRLREAEGGERLAMRAVIERESLWSRVRGIAFFARPAERPLDGDVPIPDGRGGVLGLGLALDAKTEGAADALVEHQTPGGLRLRVWRNPLAALHLDPSARPAPLWDERLLRHWPIDKDIGAGRSAPIEASQVEDLALGRGDFTVSLWLRLGMEAEDADGGHGDLVSQFDAERRVGFSLALRSQPVSGSQASRRQLHFGIDAGSEPRWRDEGRPGDSILAFALAVHDGVLYAGTCEPAKDGAGHVYRYERAATGEARWQDCGAPDRANAVSALAEFEGKLYAASAKYRLAGSALPESENPHSGGKVFRYEGEQQWIFAGELPQTEAVGGLAVYRGRLYASSLYRPSGFFRYEGGSAWTALATPEGQRVEALAVHAGGLFASSYDGGKVYRFDGTAWSDLGPLGENTQTYSFAVHEGRLLAGTWPSGRVYRLKDGAGSGAEPAALWEDLGRLGEELEVMGMAVHNGKLYAGTLPLAEVYRFDGPGRWTRVGRVDQTPNVKYRRSWAMATHAGRLFVSALPSGRVMSLEAGPCATLDRALVDGWHHVAALRRGDHLEFWVDGAKAAESERFDPAAFDLRSDAPLRIGAGPGARFNGRLREVRLYRGALAEPEIAAMAKDGPR